MLLSISTLRNSRSFTVFSVTPLSILSNCSLVNSRPATAAASRSMSFVSWGAAAVRAGGATSEGRASDGFPSDNRAQSTPGKSVEVKPSEEKYARNERRSVVRFMSKGNILPWRKEFVYCGSDKPYTAENGEEDRAAALRAPTGAAATLAMASRQPLRFINPGPPLALRFQSRASAQPHARPPVSLRPANLLLNTAEWGREKQRSGRGHTSTG